MSDEDSTISDAVSLIEHDSLECFSAGRVISASNRNHGPKFTRPIDPNVCINDETSLQELIEAELSTRLDPLQPDSLDVPVVMNQKYQEHFNAISTGGDFTTLIDSLEGAPFSLDSLVDIESEVDLISLPKKAASPISHNSPNECNHFDTTKTSHINDLSLENKYSSTLNNISDHQIGVGDILDVEIANEFCNGTDNHNHHNNQTELLESTEISFADILTPKTSDLENKISFENQNKLIKVLNETQENGIKVCNETAKDINAERLDQDDEIAELIEFEINEKQNHLIEEETLLPKILNADCNEKNDSISVLTEDNVFDLEVPEKHSDKEAINDTKIPYIQEPSFEITPQSKNHVHNHSVQSILDVTNSYHTIDAANESIDVHILKQQSLSTIDTIPAGINGATEKGEEPWPEENNGDEDLDEFQLMEKEVMKEMEEEKKKINKESDKRSKKKKRKKIDAQKENMKTAYQNKDELIKKHIGPRVRSFDAAKMKSKFNKPKEPTQVSPNCRICGKIVFQMEKIVAEKASWHKNCFRCTECNKNLTLETYQSHEGTLYCKPHFKELFRPKPIIQDEAEERKERLLRRPKMIILESKPEILSDDVVRATITPDYGLDELHRTLNVKQRFAVFENKSKEVEEPTLEPISVRRSQSLMSKAARFTEGIELNEEGEEEEDVDEEFEETDEEYLSEEDEEGNRVKTRKKRPKSFSGMGDLKAAWEQKQRREEMKVARKEDLSKFRQMLCAGKNVALKEMFESGNFENDDEKKFKEEINIESGPRAASNLKARFEKGQPFILEDNEEEGISTNKYSGEILEVEEIFKEAETAKNARNVFRNIDSKLSKGGAGILLRSPSYASSQNKDNRLSLDGVTVSNDSEVLGRNPNLIKCTDNYEDEIDCKNTKNILQMFKKLELGPEEEEDDEGPRPMKCFTPPPDNDHYEEDSEEYTDEEYSDEDDDEDSEEDLDEDGKPKFKDELLQMGDSTQSSRKAANLRAKFEKWEANQNDLNREKNEEDLEECRPSLDTARNLKAMFEHKANESVKPITSKPVVQKINRFV